MQPDDGLPPQDREAELYVLGAILRDATAWDTVSQSLTAEDFYFAHHQRTFRVIQAMAESSLRIDARSLAQELGRERPTWPAGAIDELITDAVSATGVVPVNTARNAEIVRNRAAARRLIHLCQEMVRDAHSGEPVEDLVARLETDIFHVAESAVSDRLVHIDEAKALVADAINRQVSGERSQVIPTGLPALDNLLGGLHPGHLTIVAARPSVGKSALALRFARSAAEAGFGTLIFTMEMLAPEWAQRFVASGHSIHLNRLTGSTPMDPPSAARLREALAETGLAVWLDDRGSHTADSICSVVRRAHRVHKVRLVIVDYLGLIQHSGRKGDTLAAMIGQTTKRLKQLALKLQIPIVCLAQLNREVEKRGDGRPQLSDLRDSGDIEQDSDNVLMLWPEAINDPENPPEEQLVRVCVEKQRSGPRGVVPLNFVRRFVRFEPQLPGY